MKTTLFLCLALVLSMSVAKVEAGSEQIADELLEASGVKAGMEESFMSAINPILEQIKRSGGSPAMVEEMMQVVKKFYADNYKWESICPTIAKACAAEMSDDDMKAIIAFYQTPAGKVAATKLPMATRKGSEEIATMMQSKRAELQAAMTAVVQKHMADAAKESPKK